MSQIISLRSKNVKRLSAVSITPQGNVVVIGGKNGQGKSSVLDSIFWALGGDPSAKMPVRRGEEKSRTVIEIGEPGKPAELVVTRVFTAAGGTSLVVKNADGAKQSTPQAILDKLVGKLTFDPLDFARQKPPVQAETMRVLVGLDFTAHDAAHDKLFDERTAVNRHVKQLEGQLAGMPKHEGLPETESSTADILAEQQAASEKNAENEAARNALAALKAAQQGAEGSIGELENNVARLTRELRDAEKKLKDTNMEITERAKTIERETPNVEALKDTDLSQFQTRAATVEETNRKIRSNVQRADLVTALKGHSDNAEKMTERLDKMDSDKRKKTTEAKYPVEGLLVDAAGGITLNGIPFEQCSAAEQLRVSVSVGFAINPKLRVLLIRDGSLLDDESMVVLAKMAEEAKAQIWLERVGTDAHTSVIIEDGHVQGQEPEQIPPPGDPSETMEKPDERGADKPEPPVKPAKQKRQPDLL